MRITTTTLLTTALALLTTAAPTDPPTDPSLLAIPVPSLDTNSTTFPPLTLRGLNPLIRRVQYCSDSHRRGACATQAFRTNQCYAMAPSFNDKMSSIYPIGHTACAIYQRGGCNPREGRSATVTDPGYDDLGAIGMNDMVSSIKCTAY